MPRLLDLFCGRFGWGRAFAARGWEVVGVDLVEPAEIPMGCEFRQADVLELTGERIKRGEFDFICASSPCEQFSLFGMPCFHPNPPYPAIGIRLFNHTREICEASGIPYVMENVRAAEQFIGRAIHRCGPFSMWGNGVPPLMPQGITKGMGRWSGGEKIGAYKRESQHARNKRGPATIPPELASCVADYAARLLEVAA